jgi:hypothetical protein
MVRQRAMFGERHSPEGRKKSHQEMQNVRRKENRVTTDISARAVMSCSTEEALSEYVKWLWRCVYQVNISVVCQDGYL